MTSDPRQSASEPREPVAPKGVAVPGGSLVRTRIESDSAVSGVVLEHAEVTGEEFEFVDIDRTHVRDCALGATRWRRCTFGDTDIERSDLANAVFVESGFQRVRIAGNRMTGADLSGCTIQNTELTDAVADLTNWRYAKLKRVTFRGCRLSGADFAYAELEDVRFVDCDLTGAQFRSVRISRLRFERCALDGLGGVEGLSGAVIDPLDLIGLGYQLAAALGIEIADPDASSPAR